jgi:phage/plasmid-associated DNA primase
MSDEHIPAFFPSLDKNDRPLAELSDDEFDEVKRLAREEFHKAENDLARAADGLDRHFLFSPTNGLLADILERDTNGSIIYEPLNSRSGQFWKLENDCFVLYDEIKNFARKAGEAAIERGLAAEKRDAKDDVKDIKDLYSLAGKAYTKCRSRDFLAGSVALFSERVTVRNIRWNEAKECLPLKNGIYDYSRKTPTLRKRKKSEYWRDPLPYTSWEIDGADEPKKWLTFLEQVHPDEDTRKMARQLYSLIVRNRSTKLFQLWTNEEGNGAKNTVIDIFRMLLGDRVRMLTGSVITTKGDSSERRFFRGQLEDCMLAVFDEVTGTFDIHTIKGDLTGGSEISVEKKSVDPKRIRQTFVTVVLTNKAPAFYPADDTAFISRLYILPYQSIFYPDEEAKTDLLKQGVDPSRLHPARENHEILEEMKGAAAGIMRMLVQDYLELRDVYNLRPVLSGVSRMAKNVYKKKNDILIEFLEEYFIRDADGFVTNERIDYLYKEYTGFIKPSMRAVHDDILKRWKFVERGKKKISSEFGYESKRGMAGMRERRDEDDERGRGDTSSTTLVYLEDKNIYPATNLETSEICPSVPKVSPDEECPFF